MAPLSQGSLVLLEDVAVNDSELRGQRLMKCVARLGMNVIHDSKRDGRCHGGADLVSRGSGQINGGESTGPGSKLGQTWTDMAESIDPFLLAELI